MTTKSVEKIKYLYPTQKHIIYVRKKHSKAHDTAVENHWPRAVVRRTGEYIILRETKNNRDGVTKEFHNAASRPLSPHCLAHRGALKRTKHPRPTKTGVFERVFCKGAFSLFYPCIEYYSVFALAPTVFGKLSMGWGMNTTKTSSLWFTRSKACTHIIQ